MNENETQSEEFRRVTDTIGMRPEVIAAELGVSLATYMNYRAGRVKRLSSSTVDAARRLATDALANRETAGGAL